MSIKADSVPVIPVPRDLSEQALEQFEQSVDAVIKRQPGGLELDCADLQLVSSSHVTVLWSARERCQQAQVPMTLRNVSDGLLKILKVLDLLEFFDFDSAPDVGAIGPGKRGTCGEDTRTFRCELRPTSEEILDSLNSFREFLKNFKVDAMRALELETVLYETLTNIQTHGHVGPDGRIEVVAEANNRAVEITFTDDGRAFNPAENIPQHDPDQIIRNRQTHGFGLTIISRMTDSMEYERVDDRFNVLKLKKYWDR